MGDPADHRALLAPALRRREWAWAILGCALAVTLFLGPALFTGRILSPADWIYSYYPWKAQPPPGWTGPGNPYQSDPPLAYEPWLHYAAERLRAGELPLWNPDNWLGAPFIGAMQPGVFYPLNWIYFAWPDRGALVLRAWLALFIAALGMYVLAREVAQVGPLAASLAAVSLTFGAYLTVWLLYGLTDAAIWLPWLWWATAHLVTRPTPRGVALLAGLFALVIFAGHPESVALLGLATGPLALFGAFQAGGGVKPVLARLVAWVAGMGLGAALGAIQVLPFLEYLQQSAILSARLVFGTPNPTLPARQAWLLVSPDLFGNPARGTWWPTDSNYLEISSYCGLLPLLLAPLALAAPGRTRWRFAGLLLALVALSLGLIYHAPVLYEAVAALPGVRVIATQRLLLVVQFALALLGALGAEALIHWPPARRRALLGLLLAATLALLAGGVAVPALLAHSFFQISADSPVANSAWQQGLARAGAVALVGALLLAGIAVTGRARLRQIGLVFLPVLLFADLWQAHGDFNVTVAPVAYFPPTPEIQFLQQHAGLDRVVADHEALPANTNLMYGLTDLRGYDALEPQLYHDLAWAIDRTLRFKAGGLFMQYRVVQVPLMNLLGVRYVLALPGNDLRYQVDIRQDSHTGQTTGPSAGDHQPGQTFIAAGDNLAQIQVRGATDGGRAHAPLIFHLKSSPAAATDLVTQALDPTDLPDNDFWAITFPPLPQTQGRSFYFYLEAAPDTPGPAPSLWYSSQDAYPAGSRTEQGQPVAGDLAFRALSLPPPAQQWFVPVLDGGATRATIFENRRVLPRAWLVHRVEVQPDAQAQPARLNDPAFDLQGTALLAAPLSPDAPLPVPAPPPDQDAVTITRYAPETVDITTTSPAAGLLLLSDQAFPGWTATVDGRAVAILTADHALRAVYVPAGAHRVQFAYRPLLFLLGAALSGGTLLGGLLALLVMGVGSRRAPRPDVLYLNPRTGKGENK